MEILTDQEILEDIQEFKKRITAAREKLSSLPEGHLAYPEKKKREHQRRLLQGEIRHIEKLIGYAAEALNERQPDLNVKKEDFCHEQKI